MSFESTCQVCQVEIIADRLRHWTVLNTFVKIHRARIVHYDQAFEMMLSICRPRRAAEESCGATSFVLVGGAALSQAREGLLSFTAGEVALPSILVIGAV